MGTHADVGLLETTSQDPDPVIVIATNRNWVTLLSLMTILPG